jgi:SAM-dependent methyltransferase
MATVSSGIADDRKDAAPPGGTPRPAAIAQPLPDALTPALTDAAFWDDYWRNIPLPSEVKHTPTGLYMNAILGVLDRHLPHNPGWRALEIGGAPGTYLAYLHKRFAYDVCCLDSSPVGCAKTRENFDLLNIPGHVHEADFLNDPPSLPPFDVVLSLGLIEHFDDPMPVVGAHVALLRPGGFLVLGCPNLNGLGGWLLRRLAPRLMDRHNAATTTLARFRDFERRFGLTRRFAGYVGGFEPRNYIRCENETFANRALRRLMADLAKAISPRFGFLRRFNSPYHSGYLMAVYQTTHINPQATTIG